MWKPSRKRLEINKTLKTARDVAAMSTERRVKNKNQLDAIYYFIVLYFL